LLAKCLIRFYAGSLLSRHHYPILFPDLANPRAQALQFFHHVLIAPLEMINSGNLGGAAGGQTGDHQGGRSPQIGGHDRCAAQFIATNSTHHGTGPFDGDIGPHALKFRHMHESVFKE